jgi:rhodanese-related sulfurtransferase
VGVRGARLVLFDNDGVRAPAVASWLRQMGHDASVLEGGLSSGLSSGLSLAPAALPVVSSPATLATIDAHALAARLEKNDVALIDLRGSMAFRAGHIAQARWSIRPRLAADVKNETRQLVLVADDAALAAWTASSELAGSPAPLLLQGGMAAWRAAGLPVAATPELPADGDCIDYLFFVHDRHDGNKEAARRYLAWETGLVAQLDAQERAAFRLPAPHA